MNIPWVDVLVIFLAIVGAMVFEKYILQRKGLPISGEGSTPLEAAPQTIADYVKRQFPNATSVS